jgi:hypothetical protein
VLVQGDGIALLSNFYPVLARREAGGWISSEAKAIGDVTSDELGHVRAKIRSPSEVRTQANGSPISESVVLHARGRGKHSREKQIVAACVRDFALVAGENLESVTRLASDVQVESHFSRGNRKAGEHVLDTASDSLARFEQRFGRYPYTHFSVAEAPLTGAGGIEFSGMAVVARLLYGGSAIADLGGLGALAKNFSRALGPRTRGRRPISAGRKRSLDDPLQSMREFVTTHEVAHQWWHGLIGSDSQQTPFLDESLAQYSTLVYLEDRYGKARAERDASMNVKLGYLMMRAMGTADGRVSRPAAEFPSSLAYAGLVYGKAPYFFHALRQSLGDRAFFERLRAYAERHRFRTARPEDLLDAFASGGRRREIDELARRWLERAHGDEDIGGGGLLALLGGTPNDAARAVGTGFGTRAVAPRRRGISP